jgi:hypothetical protein
MTFSDDPSVFLPSDTHQMTDDVYIWPVMRLKHHTLWADARIVTQGRTAMSGSAPSVQRGIHPLSDIGYTVVEPMR